MPAKQTQAPEGAPGANKPGAGAVIQLSPEDEAMVNEYALQHGVPRAEALRKLLFFAQAGKDQQPTPTILTKSMQTINDAKALGLAGTDANDALNVMGRSVAIQTLGKELMGGGKSGGKVSIEDIKELMYLKIMGNMAGGGGDSEVSKVVQEMREENKTTREFYEKRIDDMEKKMHDMVFEKRIQTMQETQDQALANIGQQMQDLAATVNLYKNAPANASLEQKQDAISRLKSASNEIKEIKNALTELGIIPQASVAAMHTGEPGKEVWRNPDGSTNKVIYFLDRITGAAENAIDAWQKKTPDFEKIDEPTYPKELATPEKPLMQSGPGTISVNFQMTEEEYYNLLCSKHPLNPNEQQWLNANAHRFAPKRIQPAPEPRKEAEPPQETLTQLCRKCGRPEVIQDGLCGSCLDTTPVPQ